MMAAAAVGVRCQAGSMTTQLLQRRVWHPRLLWPRESDLVGWLAEHLDQLADCLGIDRLEFVGRETAIGERCDRERSYGRRHPYSEMRLDLAATDEQAAGWLSSRRSSGLLTTITWASCSTTPRPSARTVPCGWWPT